MKIETKLDINAECYVIYRDKIRKTKVLNIVADINWDGRIQITYWVKDVGQVPEKKVFATKKEILKFLEETIEEV